MTLTAGFPPLPSTNAIKSEPVEMRQLVMDEDAAPFTPISAGLAEGQRQRQLTHSSHPRKNLTVFLAQVLVCLVVIIAAIYNLSTNNQNKTLWTSLLSANIGYLLPNPSLKAGWRGQRFPPPPTPSI